jgi:hypothetical protein
MSHGLPEQIYTVQFSYTDAHNNPQTGFIIGKLIVGNNIKLVNGDGTPMTAYIVNFENMSNNDSLINTDQGKIGPVKSDSRFKFDQVVGIGGRDKMTNNASEQIRVVKFLYTKPSGETKERYIIGKIIKKGDIINLIDGDRTLTPTITDFENTTWSRGGEQL